MKRIILITLSICFLYACNSSKNITKQNSSEKELLAFQQLMAGKYNSQAQSVKDTSYFNISLVMKPIWQDRTDGKWLYV